MKKIFFTLVIVAIAIVVFIQNPGIFTFGDFGLNSLNNNNKINTTYNGDDEGRKLGDNLSEGFYIKKGDRFYEINNKGGYLDYINYLIVPNSCYNENLEMNKNDEIIYINDDKEINGASIWYYEDLNFSTIGQPFNSGNENDKFLYLSDAIGDAKNSLYGYSKVTAIDDIPIKTRISHDYFINNLIADKEYTLSCIKGTKTEKVIVKADCHILKNNDRNSMRIDNCIAETGWTLSTNGYVSLNKNFANSYGDISTFSKDGFYLIQACVSGYSSNHVTSILVKYKN